MRNKSISVGDQKEEILEYAYELMCTFDYVIDNNNQDSIYVKYEIDGVKSFDNFRSKKFQSAIRNNIRNQMNVVKIPSLAPLYTAIMDNSSEYEKVDIHTRFAGDEDINVYFLADDSERPYIKITADTIKYCKSSKYYFSAGSNNLPQVKPKITEDSLYDLLRDYVNLDDKSYMLFIVYLCQLFMANTAHMICVISSSHGSGKSTLTRVIRRLVDPTKAENSLVPKNTDDLINHCANNNVICFDNTKPLSSDESDILCAAVTGTTIAKRTLYTTCDETLLSIKNIVIINGIDIIPKKTDFIERSLLFELQKITPDKRISENEFFKCFEEDKPHILYRIFKTVSKAMAIKKELELTVSHRMYDAFFDMCAIAVALGFKLEDFQEVFFENNKKLEKAYAENDLFVNAIIELMTDRNNKEFTDTVSGLYKILGRYFKGNDYPKSASLFSRKLSESEKAINDMGYTFCIKAKKDAKYITLNKKK